MPFTTDFDERLSEIDHYRLYPELYPWIGKHYRSQDTKILAIGESHYLEPGSNYHLDASAWYQGVDVSARSDRANLITRNIIRNGINRGWVPRSKLIYKNIESALRDGDRLAPDGETPMSTIAFYNYFQRPAEKTGESICVTDLDRSHSAATLFALLDVLRPDIVLFCSRLAWKAAKSCGVVRLAEENNIKLVNTVHPSSSWWNRKMKTRNDRTGKQIVVDALLTAKAPETGKNARR